MATTARVRLGWNQEPGTLCWPPSRWQGPRDSGQFPLPSQCSHNLKVALWHEMLASLQGFDLGGRHWECRITKKKVSRRVHVHCVLTILRNWNFESDALEVMPQPLLKVQLLFVFRLYVSDQMFACQWKSKSRGNNMNYIKWMPGFLPYLHIYLLT